MFEDHRTIESLAAMAATRAAADWKCFYGDTFKGKYPSLYVKLVEISNVIVHKVGTGGYFWIACSNESFTALQEGKMQYEHAPRCMKGVWLRGLLEGEWRVYTDVDMKPGLFLIGSSPQIDGLIYEPRRFGTLTLANFIEGREENLDDIVAELSKRSKSAS